MGRVSKAGWRDEMGIANPQHRVVTNQVNDCGYLLSRSEISLSPSKAGVRWNNNISSTVVLLFYLRDDHRSKRHR